MKRFLTISLCIAIFSATLCIVGCGDGRLKTEPVRGVITLDGKPLADATVNFTPENEGEGIASFGQTNEQGMYLLQTLSGAADAGTLPGEYIVTVIKYKTVPTGRQFRDQNTGEMIDDVESVLLFPGMARYASVSETPFRATVVKGRNTFDFQLTEE